MEFSIQVKAKDVVMTNWTNLKRGSFDPRNSHGKDYSNSVKFYYISFCNNFIIIIGCIKIKLFMNVTNCLVISNKGASVRKTGIF